MKLFDFVDPDSQISFDSKIIYTIIERSLCIFQENIWPGLPWSQCWTNILLKNPDAIQNGLAHDWCSRGQEFIERVRRTGDRKDVLLCKKRFCRRHCALRTVKYKE